MYPLLLVLAIALLPVVVLATYSLLSVRPTNLGVTEGRLAPCPSSPNCVCTQALDEQHWMKPLPLTGTPQEAIERIKAAVLAMPRTRIVAEQPHYLHAEFTSRLFRYVDDVEFYVDEGKGLIHFRSASRAGRSDFGVNRARMQQLRDQLQKNRMQDRDN